MREAAILELFAPLFSYPDGNYRSHAAECLKSLRDESSEGATEIAAFSSFVASLTTEDLQELYTRTFDLNPLCTLEIGWQLYGEEYLRGEFLVKMRQQLRARGIRESGELPDHMSHALALLAKLEPEEAAEFGGKYVLPALDKMRRGWSKDRNAFGDLVDGVFHFLRSQYPYEPARAVVSRPELRVLQ